MVTQQWHTADKTNWQPGPWKGEEDKVSWTDARTGYPCLAVRNPAGCWCGYVGVGPGHLAYEVHYDNVDANAHGGLTYSDHCQEESEHYPTPMEKRVCHPAEGDDPVWWLGFDCMHSGDLAPHPSYEHYNRTMGDYPGYANEYRDLAYVQEECEQLAAQLLTLTPADIRGGREPHWDPEGERRGLFGRDDGDDCEETGDPSPERGSSPS